VIVIIKKTFEKYGTQKHCINRRNRMQPSKIKIKKITMLPPHQTDAAVRS
jgi:hypothetical protein